MLSVYGNIIIDPKYPIDEKPLASGKGTYFNFRAVSKDPYRPIRHYYRISCFVRAKELDEARKALRPKAFLELKGELEGHLMESGGIAIQVKTKWEQLEPLAGLPNGDHKQQDDDVQQPSSNSD